MSLFKKDDPAPPLKTTPATPTAKPAGTSTDIAPAQKLPVQQPSAETAEPIGAVASPAPSSSTSTAAVILPGVQSAMPVANASSTIGAQVAPATNDEPPPAEEYSYDPKSRRDPFQSMIKLIKVDQSRRDLPPLQRVEITDMKLVGIISGGYGYYALIQTPDGKGYTVRDGTLMGTNNGVIKSISEKRIVISEPTIDVNGKKTTREIELLQRLKEVNE